MNKDKKSLITNLCKKYHLDFYSQNTKEEKVYYKKINAIVGLLNDYRNELNFNSDP